MFGLFKKKPKQPPCALCGKVVEKPIFEKGKFFCSQTCLNKYKAEAKKGKSDKEICEFC